MCGFFQTTMVQDFFHVQEGMFVIGISCVGLSFFCCFNLFLVWDNLVIWSILVILCALFFLFSYDSQNLSPLF